MHLESKVNQEKVMLFYLLCKLNLGVLYLQLFFSSFFNAAAENRVLISNPPPPLSESIKISTLPICPKLAAFIVAHCIVAIFCYSARFLFSPVVGNLMFPVTDSMYFSVFLDTNLCPDA